MPLPDALLAAGKELMVEAIEMGRQIKLPSWDFARRKVGARKGWRSHRTPPEAREQDGPENKYKIEEEKKPGRLQWKEERDEEDRGKERMRKGRKRGVERESGERTTSVGCGFGSEGSERERERGREEVVS